MGSLAITVLVFAVGLIVPVLWILRAWLEDRALSAPLALGALAAHVALLFGSLALGVAWSFGYAIVVLALIALAPTLNLRIDHRERHRMAEEDIAKYERLLQRDPHNAAVLAALGRTCVECARYDEAIEALERATALDPLHTKDEAALLTKARALKAEAEQKKRPRNSGE